MINLYGFPKNFDKISKIYRIINILYFLRAKSIKIKYKDDIIKYVNSGGYLNNKWFFVD